MGHVMERAGLRPGQGQDWGGARAPSPQLPVAPGTAEGRSGRPQPHTALHDPQRSPGARRASALGWARPTLQVAKPE